MDIEVQARKAAEVLGEEVVQGTINKLVQIERERCLRQKELSQAREERDHGT